MSDRWIANPIPPDAPYLTDLTAVKNSNIVGVGTLSIVRNALHARRLCIENNWLLLVGSAGTSNCRKPDVELLRQHELEHHPATKVKGGA